MVFQLIGGSNFQRIEFPTHSLHEGFIRNSYTNLSVGGLSVHPKRGKFLLDYVDTDIIDKTLILFVNANGYGLTDYGQFITDYISAIRQLIARGYHESSIIILTPLIRGNNVQHHADQLTQINRFKKVLHQLHVTYYDTYSALPIWIRDPSRIFGRRSIRQKNYLHYSADCRNFIHDLVGEALLNAFQLDF